MVINGKSNYSRVSNLLAGNLRLLKKKKNQLVAPEAYLIQSRFETVQRKI